MKMEYIKKEFKKLTSISLIGVGCFLIIEHIYSYGYISLGDFFGHEWIGILFLVGGILLSNKKWSEEETRIQYAKKKLKKIILQ